MMMSTVVAYGPRTPQVPWLPVIEPQLPRSLGVNCARVRPVVPLPCVCRIRIGIDRSLGPVCWIHRRMLLEYDFQWS